MNASRSEIENALPRLTVIVPCRNEEAFISGSLDSILQNDYPRDRLEIIVADGLSTDSTWSIISRYAAHCPAILALRNEKKVTPAGLNLAVQRSSGEVICRVDARARIAPDYLRRCVTALQKNAVENVGGAMRTLPPNSSVSAKSIAFCLSHPFGVGKSDFRIGTKAPVLTDTVFGGCYRKSIFSRIGMFNERLARSQDIEFNQRVRRAGGKILLDPAIHCDYFPSAEFLAFAKHNYQDGMWSVLPFAFSDAMPVRLRHLVPLFTVTLAVLLCVSGVWWLFARFAILLLTCCYLAAAVVFSGQLAFRVHNLRHFFVMPLVFAVRHVAYGVGSLCGAAKLLLGGSIPRILFRYLVINRTEHSHIV